MFPEQKMLKNDRKEIASKAITSIRHWNDIEKSTWRTHRYFVDFESRIHVEISTPFKIDEISWNFPRGILTSNRWRMDEDVSIGCGSKKKKRKSSQFTRRLISFIFYCNIYIQFIHCFLSTHFESIFNCILAWSKFQNASRVRRCFIKKCS